MTEAARQRVTKWIQTNIVPKIAKSLGKSNKNVRCVVTFPENSFFLSCVCFVNLTFQPDENANGTNKFDLVIKRLPFDETLTDHMNMTMHFHNEILFYKKVAQGNRRFPRCFFATENTDNPESTAIATENIYLQGYDMCPETYDVPLEYVLAAVKEIATFHAMAYAMKELKPKAFREVVDDIKEARFIPGRWQNVMIDIVSSRPINWLRKNNCDSAFCDRIQKHFDNAFNEVMLPAVKPVEPLATLCHGDFTRNNIFFRRIDGQLEAMLIDFATIGYSSPGIDLSTFLYLNCSNADRSSNFDDIFGSYYGTLIDELLAAGINDTAKYSYANVLAEYKRVAAFGYVIASYFLPIVRDPDNADIDELRADIRAGAETIRKMGGEVMDEIFGNMILELRDTGCLDHVP